MAAVSKKILIVEDEAIIAVNQAQMLRDRGYEVLIAYSGENAVEIVGSEHVDLILMDIDLGSGQMDGTEAASLILNVCDLPIVFLSSHTEPEIVERTEKITSYGYVVKNSGETVLDASIKMAFRLYEANQKVVLHRGETEAAMHETLIREQRLDHLNRVLISIRNINQIITKDSGKQELLDNTCRFLVEKSGYYNAWIVLLEQERAVEPFYHKGFAGGCFNLMVKKLRSGDFPVCVRQALESGDIIVTENPAADCDGCMLQHTYASESNTEPVNAGMTSRIEHAGEVYGWLSVSVPSRYAGDAEEHALFRDIVDDIGYALHKKGIEIEKTGAVRELQREKTERESILDSLVEHVIYESPKLEIIWPNRVACESVGMERDEIIGRHCYEIWPQRTEVCPDCPVQEALRTGQPHEIIKSTPDARAWFIRGYPVKDEDGQIQGAVEVTLDITEQKTAEDRLKRLSERMTLATDSAGIGVWDLDIENKELIWDEWMYRIYGVRSEDYASAYEVWTAGVHPEDLERMNGEIDLAIHGQKSSLSDQFRIVTPEGDIRYIQASAVVIEDETGRPARMTGVSYDITDRVKTEEYLHYSREKLKATLNSIGDAVIATDIDGKIVRMNPVAEQLTGWKLDDASGKPLPHVFRIINSRTGKTAPNPVEKVLHSGQIVGLANHTMLLSRDGYQYQIADSAAPIRDSQGRISGVVLVFRDVSEEYRIKEELRLNEDRLSKVMLAANDGTWDWDLTTDEVYYDPRYYEMAGYKPDEFPHTLEEFVRRIHPDDRDQVMNTADLHLKGKIDRFNVEFRFETKEGGWIWIMGRGIIVERAADGTPTRFIGTHTDIDDRKAVEEQLRIESRRLADVLEGTNVGSWEWNVQTGEIVLNERWAEIVGYSLDEISPTTVQTWIDFVHPDDLKVSDELLRRHLHGDTEYYECEVRMRHKDGSWVWVLDRGKLASRTADGKPLLVSGTHQDITERKIADAQRLNTLHEKEVLLSELQHRVKNSFGLILSMLSLQSGTVKTTETREVLATFSSRVRAISELYTLLYQSDTIQEVQLDQYCAKVVASMRHMSTRVRISTDLQRLQVPVREAGTVGLILTELVTNAINHAYSDDEEGSIEVRLKRHDVHVILEVENGGRPFPEDFDFSSSAGLGLQLVKAMVDQFRGTIDFLREERTVVRVGLRMQSVSI